MKMNRLLLICILPVLFSACNNWLDVQPEEQISEDEVFSTGNGYRNVLNGVYKSLSGVNMYGREMTWGLMDVLAQCYNVQKIPSDYPGRQYSEGAAFYDYEYTDFHKLPQAIWEEGYNAVANCNNLIAHARHADPDLFELKESERALLEGEALALRAFIQFDMLRIFAPAPVTSPKGTYIPYIKSYPEVLSVKLSVEECMENVIRDLEDARKLVYKYDSIDISKLRIAERFSGGSSSSRFFEYRGFRMNYYAVSGILARAYLYNNQPNEAYKIAKEIIDFQNSTKYYNFTSASKMANGNLKFYDDILCGFYSAKLTDWDKALNDVLSANGEQLFMEVKEVDNLFNGETDDYRKRYQLSAVNRLMKYAYQNNATSEGILSSNLIPIIRMSEIYYIAAETCFDKDPSEAIDYLMQVKKGRNLRNVDLSGITLKSDFMDRLISDARREFLGEGQIFFMFKRLNQSVPTVNNWKPEYFILDVPDSENI